MISAKKTKGKKVLALLIALIMLIQLLPVAAMAQSIDDEYTVYTIESSYPEEMLDAEVLHYPEEIILDVEELAYVKSNYEEIIPFLLPTPPHLRVTAEPRVSRANQDDYIYVDFRVTPLPGLGWTSIAFAITYDTTRLELVPYQHGAFGPVQIGVPTGAPWTATPGLHTSGQMLLNVMNPAAINIMVPAVATLRFRVLTNAPAGYAVVGWDYNDFWSATNQTFLPLVFAAPASPVPPSTVSPDFGEVWIGSMALEVAVNGPLYADITVEHGTTNFVQAGRVFTATTLTALEGTVTVSAPGFVTAAATIPAYVDGIARITVNLQPQVSQPHLGTLVGRVTHTTTGLGIAGATVTVITATGVVEVPTNSLGYYVAIDLAPGNVTVLASAYNFYANFAPNNPVAILVGATATANIQLTPIPGGYQTGGYTLTVTVTGTAAGADISLSPYAFTRDRNVFVITTPDPLTGSTLTASSHGYVSNTAVVPAYNAQRRAFMEISLSGIIIPLGRGAIQGSVTRVADDSAIPGAVVVLLDAAGAEVARTTTDANGEYLFNNLLPSNYRLVVAPTRYIAQSRDVVVIADTVIRENFALAVDIGVGPNDFTLVVNLANIGNAPGTVRLNGTTLRYANGVWTATAASAMPLTGLVRAVAVGFMPAEFTVMSGHFGVDRVFVLSLTLVDDSVLPPTGVLRGFVREEADRITAIPNATVTAIHSNGTRHVTTADADGFYSFTNLPNGTYTVIAEAAGFSIGVSELHAVLGANGANANVYLDNNPFIDHLIIVNVEPAGAVAGAVVTLGIQPLDHMDGNAWYMALPFALAASLEVSSPGFVTVTQPVAAADYVNRIAFITVRLQPEALEGMLQGYVMEAGTQNRLADATVEVVNNTTGAVSTVQTNSDGFFRFTGLPLGNYTVVAWADGFVASASPNSPVTLPTGSGVHENVYLVRTIPGVNDFNLLVTVIGPTAGDVIITMPGVTLTRIGTTNVWGAVRNTQMLGLVTASAPFFRTETYNVTPASYNVAGVAHVTLELEEIVALVRFHFGITGMPYVEIQLENLNQPIPTALIPTVPTRYGTLGNPGFAFMGWYEVLFANMHYINNASRVDYRTDAFNLATQNITEAMLTGGVLNLYASWLQFGDVTGDGTIGTIDQMLVQSYFLRLITADRLIRRTADVNLDGGINTIDQMMIQSHFLRMPVILGPQQ